jgi:hypothetical protein
VRTSKSCALINVAALAFAFSPRVAGAEPVFVVDSTLDQIDADASDGICATAAGTCTLRAAIMQANRVSGVGVTIHVPAGVYKLTRPRTPSGGERDGDLDLTTPASGNPHIRIVGSGRSTTIIDADGLDRVLQVASKRSATISGLTLRNGHTTSDGGAVLNHGSLLLTNVDVLDSRADSHYGGGIFNRTPDSGELTLRFTRVADNYTTGYGGGIASLGSLVLDQSQIVRSTALNNGGGLYATTDKTTSILGSRISDNAASAGGGILSGGIMVIERSTISDNVALENGGGIVVSSDALHLRRSAVVFNKARFGGGVFVHAPLALPGWVSANAHVLNSTIAGNDARQDGGGLVLHGTTDIYNSTIAFNMSDAGAQGSPTGAAGGGIFIGGGALSLRNTLVAKNYTADSPMPDDCRGSLGSYGRNLFGDASGCIIATATGSWGLLSAGSFGALGNHGGRTPTVPLLAGSNAINAGTLDGGCRDSYGVITHDQRGYARVGACDIGAYEFGAFDPDEIFRHDFEG